MLPATLASADDTISREYKIKAAYLYNLIKFISWPNNSTNSANIEPTDICVYGYNPFGSVLNKLTSRKAKGRPIDIYYLSTDTDNQHCEIIFIAKKNNIDRSFLNQTGSNSHLTVGEDTAFIEQGGLISLVVTHNNVQLQINHTKAKANGFQISGNLLEIAKSVR